MEASGAASAPTHPDIELEPPEWQPRAIWAGARQMCGAASFFFLAFLFAYFYLRSLDLNHDWKIGHNVNPPLGLGLAIVVVLVLSAALMRTASTRPGLAVRAGTGALVLLLAAVALQAITWSVLGFGSASGGYASVYVGWTIFYSVFSLLSAYWIETQVATAWRRRRSGVTVAPADVLTGERLTRANLAACSFFWTFYVAIGVVTFVVLYVV
jgi:heme/copper-type cytochrome/quinol oxidase subunit 3